MEYLHPFIADSMLEQGITLARLKEVGIEYRLDHVGCGAGVDRKKRLYVRCDGDIVKAYCHNCGNGTQFSLDYNSRVREAYRVSSTNSPEPVDTTRPPAIEPIVHGNYEAGAYLSQYLGKDWLALARLYGIQWCNKHYGITYPLPCGGFQVRSLSKLKHTPKYVTYKKKETTEAILKPVATIVTSFGAADALVITEDYLSAVCVTESLNNKAMGVPLFGAHVSTRSLFKLLKLQRDNVKVVVWLDNDNNTIINKSVDITSALHILMGAANVKRHPGIIEPKKMGKRLLHHVLEGYSCS